MVRVNTAEQKGGESEWEWERSFVTMLWVGWKRPQNPCGSKLYEDLGDGSRQKTQQVLRS